MPIDLNTCRLTMAGNIILPKGRLTFAQNILKPGKPKTAPAAQELKYGTSQLIPKAANLDLLRAAIKACAKEKYGDNVPKGLKFPILEAADHDYEGYTDQFWLVRPTSKQKPGIVNAAGTHVGDDAAQSEIYSGRWACISVRCFTYEVSGNRGVGLGLQNIQLLDHDESLGGRQRAEDEFEAVDGTAASGGGGATQEDPFA